MDVEGLVGERLEGLEGMDGKGERLDGGGEGAERGWRGFWWHTLHLIKEEEIKKEKHTYPKVAHLPSLFNEQIKKASPSWSFLRISPLSDTVTLPRDYVYMYKVTFTLLFSYNDKTIAGTRMSSNIVRL